MHIFEGRPCDPARYMIHIVLNLQNSLIGRADDLTNLLTTDLKSHSTFQAFTLQLKVFWSKHVLEEHDFPDHILLGVNNMYF